MSENLHPNNNEESFEDIMRREFGADAGFNQASDMFDESVLRSDDDSEAIVLREPTYMQPLDGIIRMAQNMLRDYWSRHIADDMYAVPSDEQIRDLLRLFPDELSYIMRSLHLNDTIATQSSFVMLEYEDEHEMTLVYPIGADHILRGAYQGVMIGPMPDEVSLASGGNVGGQPFSLALRLAEPVIVAPDGSIDTRFQGKKVAIMLSTDNLKLVKLHFNDEQ